MTRTRTALLQWPAMFSVTIAAVAGAGEIPDKTDALPNYVVIRPGVAAAGQPSPDTLARLRDLGFRTVVNLRTPGEPGFVDERASLEAQGVRYLHRPVTAESFSAADLSAVKAVLDDPQAGPVLIHCQSANRVGALWAALLAAEGTPLDEAEAEGRRVGLRSAAMTAAVRRVVEAAPGKK